jgi:uncharacterized protein (TIGR03067 family)
MLMKRLLTFLFVAALFAAHTTLAADDLQALTGKWSVKKTNDQGQVFTQTIEVNKDKFVFEIRAADALVLHGEGNFKLEKLGTFNCARFSSIRASRTVAEMRDVEDDYVSIYTLDGDTWTMAASFDKQREGQKPSLDIYQRVQAGAAKTAP